MLHELIWEWKWLLRQAHCFHYTGKVQLPLWGTCVFGHKADFFAAQQTREFTLGPLIWLVLFFCLLVILVVIWLPGGMRSVGLCFVQPNEMFIPPFMHHHCN